MPKRVKKVRKRTLGWWKNKIIGDVVLRLLYPVNNGFHILSESWDNLIILDACRYDVFKEVVSETKLKGELEWRISRGTTTSEFLRQNFGRCPRFEDIVYVSANPMVAKFLPRDKFSTLIAAWGHGGWNEESNTVLPETVYKLASDTIERNNDKRLIIHFLQPHAPFIGYSNLLRKHSTLKSVPLLVYDNRDTKLWSTVDRPTLLSLHKKNLLHVMPYVQQLLEVLSGTTIITADHGDAFGEWIHPLIPIRVYGHAERTRIPALVKVPWFRVHSVRKKETRTNRQAEENVVMTKEEEDLINQRLTALGYS